MHCTHCGALLPDNAKFCTSCGEPVQSAAEVTSYEPSADKDSYDSGANGSLSAYADDSHTNSYADSEGSSYSKPNPTPANAYSGRYTVEPSPSNGFAVAGFVCSLILIPVFPIGFLSCLLGLILSLVGLSNAKKLPENKGRGLAQAGTIISIIRLVLRLILLIIMIVALVYGAGQAGQNLLNNWPDIMPYSNF